MKKNCCDVCEKIIDDDEFFVIVENCYGVEEFMICFSPDCLSVLSPSFLIYRAGGRGSRDEFEEIRAIKKRITERRER